jgi:hypothetical protein
MSSRSILMCLLLNWCFAAGGFAQDDELEET